MNKLLGIYYLTVSLFVECFDTLMYEQLAYLFVVMYVFT